MHIEGKISYVGPIQSGTSQRGTAWKKQEFAVTYQEGRYPLSILLPTMDDKIIGNLQVGQQVSVDFDCEARSYTAKDGTRKMFNSFSIWRDGLHCVSPTQGGVQQAQPATQQPAQQAAQSQASPQSVQQKEELPF
nr:MAG TPA: Single-stranded DNA-binding protein, BARTONELLA HENSELAE, SINGLE-STRAND BINDING.1A [Caudoviricetes sp.]